MDKRLREFERRIQAGEYEYILQYIHLHKKLNNWDNHNPNLEHLELYEKLAHIFLDNCVIDQNPSEESLRYYIEGLGGWTKSGYKGFNLYGNKWVSTYLSDEEIFDKLIKDWPRLFDNILNVSRRLTSGYSSFGGFGWSSNQIRVPKYQRVILYSPIKEYNHDDLYSRSSDFKKDSDELKISVMYDWLYKKLTPKTKVINDILLILENEDHLLKLIEKESNPDDYLRIILVDKETPKVYSIDEVQIVEIPLSYDIKDIKKLLETL